jgi:mannosyltransferase
MARVRSGRARYVLERTKRAAHDPFVVGITVLTVVAAVLRFWTLGLQSYYTDEAYTVSLVQQAPIEMLHGIARTESTPPLYYVAAWIWSRAFGTGEAGLRSLSALAGTATVVVAYFAGARLLSRAVGLIVAALAAVSPLLIWYSQEARSYAFFTFFATLSLYLYARLRTGARPAVVVAWALVCEAAIWTHYFAIYVVATEAVLLLLLVPRLRRVVVAALLAMAVASVPVAVLAVHQQRRGHTDWIGRLPLEDRLRGAAKTFVAGHYDLAHARVVIALLAAGVVALLARAWWRRRKLDVGVVEAALFMAGLLLLPLVPAALGNDYWLTRNVMPAWVGAALVVSAAVACVRRWLATALTLALVSLSLVPTILTFERPELQRADWRGVARCLGARRPHRAVVVRSDAAALVLFGIYRPGTHRLGAKRRPVNEVDVVDRPPVNLRVPTGFADAGTVCRTNVAVRRFVAERPIPIAASDVLAAPRAHDAEVFVAEEETGPGVALSRWTLIPSESAIVSKDWSVVSSVSSLRHSRAMEMSPVLQ